MKQLFFMMLMFCTLIVGAQNTMFDVCPLKVGSKIPSTMLATTDAEMITLDSLVNSKPTVLVFYRGAWCGYCRKHLAELTDIKTEVEDLGYQILGITVDQASKLNETNEKAGSEIDVYADVAAETIKAFGLNWEVDDTLFNKYKSEYKLDLEVWSGDDHHQLPVPAIFVIKDGLVQFQYVNPEYSIRLKPVTLLAVLETL